VIIAVYMLDVYIYSGSQKTLKMVLGKLDEIERQIATKLATLSPTPQPNSLLITTNQTPSLSRPGTPDQLLSLTPSPSGSMIAHRADQLTSLNPTDPSGLGKEMLLPG